jgi:prepilin-type N-terminal cleavage/methylation domain-containing protein/prepilin-type processing-associated H-X9-DG protein
MTRQETTNARSAFTLIELLVVIAIIALLIAILLPSLSLAREQSRKSACLANLKALSTANRTYSMDNDDRLPNLNPTGTISTAGATASLLALYKYAPGPKVYRCASDREYAPNAITTADFRASDSARTSYDFYSVYFLPERMPRLSALDLAPLVWDQSGGRPTRDDLQNHGVTGGNVGFADGHAEWQPVKKWDSTNWPNPADRFY